MLYIYKSLLQSYLHSNIEDKFVILDKIKERNMAVSTNDQIKLEELDTINIDSEYYNKMKSKNIQTARKKLNNIKNTEFNIGPKPVSIEMKHIQHHTRSTMIGNEIYSVTDKADGLGKLLYVVGLDHLNDMDRETYREYNLHIYMIDSNQIIYETGLQTTDVELSNTLMNGEYINHSLNMDKVSWFKAYDLYFKNNKSTLDLPLLSEDHVINTRISNLNDVIDKLKTSMLYYGNNYSNSELNKEELLDISVKHFEIGQGTQLFNKSANIWNVFIEGISQYKYDGLIYTPINRPVGYSNNDHYDLEVGKTWFMNIKWKPPYENTIDFVVKELKENMATYGDKVLERSKIGTIEGVEPSTYNKYKTYYLEVGKNEYEYIDHCQTQLTTFKKPSQYKNLRYLSSLFKPTTPFDDNAYIAKVIMKNDRVVGNEWEREEDGYGNWENTNDIIRDNTIVEFSYNNYTMEDSRYVNNKEFRWVPLRTREDKTYKYRRGIKRQKELYKLLCKFIDKAKKFPDAYLDRSENTQINKLNQVINSVPTIKKGTHIFKTIQSNIDTIERYYPDYSFIKTVEVNRLIAYGNDYKTANNIWKTIHNPITEKMIMTGEDIPIELDSVDKYYRKDVSIKRAKSITIPLQKFHNKIKELLIKGVSTQIRKTTHGGNIHLLDLATGKGGDISKWKHNNINTVVGIDIVRDNIYNDIDGACVRRQNILKDNTEMNITFMVGDIRKNIASGDSFIEPLSKKIWGELWNNGIGHTKYDLITCMFGIHYVFSDKVTLDHFIKNIDDNIKPGGYFVGTCLDGQMLFDRFKYNMFGDYIIGEKDGKVLWKLKKKYSNEEFPQNSESLHMEIGVFMNSINQEITEYLVNFNYLVKKLKEKNIELLPMETCKDMNLILGLSCEGGFKHIYDKMVDVDEYSTFVNNLSDAETELSFLTRYFIFKKHLNQ